MPNPSRDALLLSIHKLFTDEHQELFPWAKGFRFEKRWRIARQCVLWTFTTPEAVSADEINRLWSARPKGLGYRLFRAGCMCVRVLERGTKGERRWHIHAVTPQWWDVARIRPMAVAAGFGRINAKPIPPEKASYVAKYLLKQYAEKLPVGVRRWGCVGFQGVRTCDALRKITVDNSELSLSRRFVDYYRWTVPTIGTLTFQVRTVPDGHVATYYDMELKPAQAKEVMADVLAGNIVVVGEYRGYAVRTLALADKKTGAKVDRVIVEHNVEVNGAARTVAEWLPVGQDAKAVKPVASKGDIVKVLVETAKKFGGQLTIGGTIKPLTQLV